MTEPAPSPAQAAPRAGPGWTPAWIAAIIIATVAAYSPILASGLVWNDADYLTQPALRTLGGLARIWTEPGATEQYYPLLHSFFWMQNRLWGANPLGYHLVGLGLHLGAAMLFALVLRRLAVPGAWLAALLFALHPVHVESVAWIAEQKNTLSLVCYLGAALAYLRFDRTRDRTAYCGALGLFLLSILAKTVTVTLPAALLVIFWWQRGRLEWRRDFRPLLPWLVLGAAAGLFTSWVEQHYLGARGENFALPFLERVQVAGRAFWIYAGHLVWPLELNFIYPRWTPDAAAAGQWLFPLGVLVLAAAAWSVRHRTRTPLAVFLLFAGSLFPVLGFVNLFGSLYSWVWDHWQYLPDLAPIALFAAGLTLASERLEPRARMIPPALVVLLAGALGILTWRDVHAFHDEKTLYRTILAQNPDAWMAHNNLGSLLAAQPGRAAEAVAEFETVLRLRPDHPGAHNNLGLLLGARPDHFADARAHFEAALRLRPDYYAARLNLANLLARQPGDEARALSLYAEVLRQQPDDAGAHLGLADVLARLPGRQSDAAAHYRDAIQIQPDNAIARNNLAMLLAAQPGRSNEALAQFAEALRLNPNLAEAHSNLGMLFASLPGRAAEAATHFAAAVRLQPGSAVFQNNLGNMLARQPGREAEALDHFYTALRIQPDYPLARFNLARLLERLGRPAEAAGQLGALLRLHPDDDAAQRELAALRSSAAKP